MGAEDEREESKQPKQSNASQSSKSVSGRRGLARWKASIGHCSQAGCPAREGRATGSERGAEQAQGWLRPRRVAFSKQREAEASSGQPPASTIHGKSHLLAARNWGRPSAKP